MDKITIKIDLKKIRRLFSRSTKIEKPKRGKGSYTRKNIKIDDG